MWYSKNTFILQIYLLSELLSKQCEAGIVHSLRCLWFLLILQETFFSIDFFIEAQKWHRLEKQKAKWKNLLTIFRLSGSLWIFALLYMKWLNHWIREFKLEVQYKILVEWDLFSITKNENLLMKEIIFKN